MFDRNGDGVISEREVCEILTLGELADEEQRILRRRDPRIFCPSILGPGVYGLRDHFT